MPSQPHKTYEFGPFRLESKDRLLSRNGKLISLTPKAFEVLVCLLERQGHLVGKNELMNEIWADSFVEEGNVSRTIWMLRTALGDDRNGHKFIQTIPKHGYRFVGDVEVKDADSGVTNKNSGSSANNESELLRANAPFQSGAELLATYDLKETTERTQKTTAIGPLRNRYRAGLLLGIAVVLIFTAALIFLRRPAEAPAAPITSIALLPLENLSGDQSQEFFSDGMAEILITELGNIDGLRVIERTATSRYKGTQKDISEIAKELNVEGVVKGSASLVGDSVLITIQLYRGADGRNLSSKSYERKYLDVLDLQSTIAKAIANEIKVKLSETDQASLASGYPIKPEALNAFITGIEYYTAAQNLGNGEKRKKLFLVAIEDLRSALTIDPEYVNAREKLLGSYYYLTAGGENTEYRQNVLDEAATLLKTDPANSSAHAVLAADAWRYKWDRKEAEKEFALAFEHHASSESSSWTQYALFLSSDGREDKAIESMKRAIEINPFADGPKMNLGNFYIRKHDYDKAIEYLTGITMLNPNSWRFHNPLSRALACKGMYKEAIAEAEKENEPGGEAFRNIHLAWIYARSGDRETARRILNELLRQGRPADATRPAFDAAGVYAELGDKDTAFAWLERAFTAHAPSLIWLKMDPEMDRLRGDPRYDDLLRRIGLAP